MAGTILSGRTPKEVESNHGWAVDEQMWVRQAVRSRMRQKAPEEYTVLYKPCSKIVVSVSPVDGSRNRIGDVRKFMGSKEVTGLKMEDHFVDGEESQKPRKDFDYPEGELDMLLKGFLEVRKVIGAKARHLYLSFKEKHEPLLSVCTCGKNLEIYTRSRAIIAYPRKASRKGMDVNVLSCRNVPPYLSITFMGSILMRATRAWTAKKMRSEGSEVGP